MGSRASRRFSSEAFIGSINFERSSARQFTQVPVIASIPAMDIPTGHAGNADQIAYWNGPNGKRWTDRQAEQDVLLAPVTQALIERTGAVAGERVVDVGCGCGATSLAFTREVGPTGFVLGIDISAPMLSRARELAPKQAPV